MVAPEVRPVPFTASSPEVREYQRLRRASRKLNDRLTKAIPREALDEIGARLDVLRDGVLAFPDEEAASVFVECCIQDWVKEGKNLVQQYAERAERLSPDERLLLDAWSRARYALLRIEEQWPGAGVRVRDVDANGELPLLDISLGRAPEPRDVWLVARVAPIGAYWMTTGAPTVIGYLEEGSASRMVKTLRRIRHRGGSEHDTALALASLAIRVLAARNEAEEEVDELPPRWHERTQRVAPAPRPPGRNDPCPCGSGRKYKRCCGG